LEQRWPSNRGRDGIGCERRPVAEAGLPHLVVHPNGNPSENTTIAPLVRCDIAPDTYVNIDITKVM